MKGKVVLIKSINSRGLKFCKKGKHPAIRNPKKAKQDPFRYKRRLSGENK